MTVNVENQGYHYGLKWLNFWEKQPIILSNKSSSMYTCILLCMTHFQT